MNTGLSYPHNHHQKQQNHQFFLEPLPIQIFDPRPFLTLYPYEVSTDDIVLHHEYLYWGFDNKIKVWIKILEIVDEQLAAYKTSLEHDISILEKDF